jgi:lipopolysaccharide heptosyltransferase II
MIDLALINRILLIRFSSLGDILLTTPLIRAIKSNYPAIEVDYILKSQYSDSLKYNPNISQLFHFEDINNGSGDEFISKRNYDVVIDLQNNFKSKQFADKIKAPRFKFKKLNINKFLLVHFKINRLIEMPSIPVRYASVIHNLELDEKGLELFIPDFKKSNLKKSGKYIGLCPGSRHYTKMWSEEYFIELGKILSKEGYNILLFGGKTDRDICKRISSQINNAKDYSNDDDLLQTAADLKECVCVICNDSGLMHVTSAVQTPLIVIFGSSVKEFGFTPYKNKNLILENNLLSCRPCSHIGRNKCPKGHFKCMREISPLFVFQKFNEFLKSI